MSKNICIFVIGPRSQITQFPEEHKSKHLNALEIGKENTQFIVLKADLRIPSKEKAINHILSLLGDSRKLSIQFTPGLTYSQKWSARVLLNKLLVLPYHTVVR